MNFLRPPLVSLPSVTVDNSPSSRARELALRSETVNEKACAQSDRGQPNGIAPADCNSQIVRAQSFAAALAIRFGLMELAQSTRSTGSDGNKHTHKLKQASEP